jgi:hypothetical protein
MVWGRTFAYLSGFLPWYIAAKKRALFFFERDR